MLTDLKTSKGVYISHHFQLDGYRHPYEELTDQTIDRTSVLLARDNGTYEEVTINVQRGIFLDLLKVYNHVKGK